MCLGDLMHWAIGMDHWTVKTRTSFTDSVSSKLVCVQQPLHVHVRGFVPLEVTFFHGILIVCISISSLCCT